MRIDANLPMHIARAYGLKATSAPRPAAKLNAATNAKPAQVNDPRNATGAQRLIAGSVPGEVNFDRAAANPSSNPSALQLYTRAADTIEAATGIHLGRSIDISG